MLLAQKVDIPQKLKDELIKNNLQIPDNNYPYILYENTENDTYTTVKEDSEIYEIDIIKRIKNTHLTDTFQELLFKFIDKSGLKDSEVYKKAYIDRRLFSKIRSGHKPGIKTVIRLGLVLELNMEEFNELLHSCNYSLYEDEYFDVAIKYFIKNKIYNIDKCNDILYSCNLELLNDYN